MGFSGFFVASRGVWRIGELIVRQWFSTKGL